MTARRSTPYIRLDTTKQAPTLTDGMRGQIRIDGADGTAGDPDGVVAVIKRTDGTIAYVGLVGTAIQVGDAGTLSQIQTIDFAGDYFTATESPTTEANIGLKWPYTIGIGPFFINDLPGSATTQMNMGYFNTATAVSQAATDAFIPVNGVIVGGILQSDTPRTAGTATFRVRLSGTGTAFNGGSIVLDASHTFSHSQFVAPSNGVAVTAGQRVGIEITTSGWTPTTANLAAWVYVLVAP